MNIENFLQIYRNLDSRQTAEIDNKLSDIAELEERAADLKEKLSGLSAAELHELEAEQSEYLSEERTEEADLQSSNFKAEDAETSEMFRRAALDQHDSDTFEFVTENYPMGLEWIDSRIGELHGEIRKVVQEAMRRS